MMLGQDVLTRFRSLDTSAVCTYQSKWRIGVRKGVSTCRYGYTYTPTHKYLACSTNRQTQFNGFVVWVTVLWFKNV